MKCNASSSPGRRAFLKLSGLAALGSGLGSLARAIPEPSSHADPTHRLSIQKSQVELAPGRSVTTLTYDGQLPGPVLRATVGRPVRIDVHNRTDTAERIQWHGQDVSEASTLVPARSIGRMEFIPVRAGPYFYHSQQVAALHLDAGLYSGQVGALLVDPVPAAAPHAPSVHRHRIIVLKDYEPFIHRTHRGCEIGYATLTINGRIPDDAPLRANIGEPILVHVLNASATEPMSLALPGHTFDVVALDGNPLPRRARTSVLFLQPGERMSARLTPNRIACWVARSGGGAAFDYSRFGSGTAPAPDEIRDIVLTRHDAARSGFNRWTINGASYSTAGARPLLLVRQGLRYRLRIQNTSDEVLPLHLQRHRMEVVCVSGRPTAGIIKDVVPVGAHQQVEVDFTADSPGPALIHCTRQLHKDFGLMALVDYT